MALAHSIVSDEYSSSVESNDIEEYQQSFLELDAQNPKEPWLTPLLDDDDMSQSSENSRILNDVSISIHRVRKGTMFSSVSNLTMSACGAGVLSLPYAISSSGMFLGSLILLLSALATYYSLYALETSSRNLPVSNSHSYFSYERLAVELYGPRMKVFVKLNIAIFLLGANVVFFVLIGDFIQYLLPQVFSGPLDISVFLIRLIIHLATFLSVIIPCLFDNLNSLRYISIAAMGCLFYLLGLWISRFFKGHRVPNSELTIWATEDLMKIGNTVGVHALSFSSQFNLLAIFSELREPSVKRMKVVSVSSVLACWILYNLYGLVGYMLFGVATKGNLLNNFSDKDLLVNVGRVVLSFVLLCKIPLIVVPLRVSMEETVFSFRKNQVMRTSSTMKLKLSIVLVIFLATMSISLGIPNVENLYGLLGGTCGALICFILPGLFLHSVVLRTQRLGLKRHFDNVVSMLLIVFGILVGLSSLSQSVISLVK